MDPVLTRRRRPRLGCLGCFFQVLLSLAGGVVLLLAITAVFMPWGFYLGGSFHIVPYWRGWGQMHSKLSGDYALFVRFEPSFRRGSRIYPTSSLQGIGYLCSPRGELCTRDRIPNSNTPAPRLSASSRLALRSTPSHHLQ